jgi:hypothetical protein
MILQASNDVSRTQKDEIERNIVKITEQTS